MFILWYVNHHRWIIKLIHWCMINRWSENSTIKHLSKKYGSKIIENNHNESKQEVLILVSINYSFICIFQQCMHSNVCQWDIEKKWFFISWTFSILVSCKLRSQFRNGNETLEQGAKISIVFPSSWRLLEILYSWFAVRSSGIFRLRTTIRFKTDNT